MALLSIFFSTTGMDELPGDYIFSGAHLLYVLFNIALFVVLWVILKRQNKKTQDIIITVFLILIMVLKYAGDILFIYEYNNVSPALSKYPHPFWDVDTFFSFQLCGITNILLPITIWFNIKPLKEFMYMSSILGGLSIILYPLTALYGNPFFLTLPRVRSILVHFFLLFIPLFLINRGDFTPNPKRWKQIAIGLISVAIWSMIGNLFIDVGDNNLFLMENPFFGGPIPIINVIPNGWHVLLLAVLSTLGYVIIYQFVKLFKPNIKLEKADN